MMGVSRVVQNRGGKGRLKTVTPSKTLLQREIKIGYGEEERGVYTDIFKPPEFKVK